MLLRLSDQFKKTNIFGKPYKGIVVSNDDPKKLRRVKVNIPGLIEGTEDELPWFFIRNPAMLGGSPATSGSWVPNVNSEVEVQFPFEDVYSGFVTGYWMSEGTAQGSTFNEDYPDSYGWRDEQGTYLKVNRAKKFMEIQHTSGAKVRMNQDSSIELRSRKEIKFISEDGKTQLTFDMITGSVNFDPKDVMEIKGNETRMTAPLITVDGGSKNELLSGGKTQEITGGNKKIVGGSDSRSVVGSQAISIGGDKSELIAGETEATYGQGLEETIALGDMLTKLIAGDRNVEMTLGNYKISLTAGDYDVDVTAGNITIKTSAGSFELGNAMSTMEIDLAGNIKITAAVNLDLEATGVATLKGSLTKLGQGTGPVITAVTDPLEDLIVGKPKIGVATVLAG